MKTSINKLLAGLFFSGVVLAACSKSDSINDLNNNPQQVKASNTSMIADNFGSADGTDPATGMLNRNFVITNATDGKTNMSEQFSGYTFKFTGTQPGGEAMVTTSQGTLTGTWNWREGSTMF